MFTKMTRRLACIVLMFPTGTAAAAPPGTDGDCKWITAAEAERILLEPVKAPTSTTYPVAQLAAQTPGLRDVSDCIYGVRAGSLGQVGATVYRFATATDASRLYDRLRTSSEGNGSRIVPVRGIGDAAFLANPPALSDGVMVIRRGADVVRLSRIAGKVLKAAIEKAPDDERFDLYGLAPLVLKRL